MYYYIIWKYVDRQRREFLNAMATCADSYVSLYNFVPRLLSGAKVHLYLLSVFITSNTDFVYHPPVVFVTSRKVFGRFCIRYKPVLYTLVFVFGCKIRKFYWNRNDLTPIFLRFCGNTSGVEIDTLLRKRLRKYAHRYLLFAHRKHRNHRNLKWNQWERMITWTRIARIERIVLKSWNP